MVFAAKVSEIPEFGKKLVQVAGQDILLVKTKGVVYACETECPHQGAPCRGPSSRRRGASLARAMAIGSTWQRERARITPSSRCGFTR